VETYIGERDEMSTEVQELTKRRNTLKEEVKNLERQADSIAEGIKALRLDAEKIARTACSYASYAGDILKKRPWETR
jgi:uncharacterized coiled-coil DUF342 family protein